MPPLRNAPSGTSLTSRSLTDLLEQGVELVAELGQVAAA